MPARQVSAPGIARGFWSELAPRAGRLEGTLQITVAALLVTVVMLTFRMPFLFVGPYLTFILCQRDTLLTRAVAAAAVVMVAAASLLVCAIALLAWDAAWLRVSLLAAVFFAGFFLMRAAAVARILLGPLVILSLFAYAFDTVPLPNALLDQLGWIWGIFGLLFVATFLTQWLLRAPTALELFRRQMRQALVAAEQTCLRMAFGRSTSEPIFSSEEHHDAAVRLKLLGATRVLQPDQVARCAALLQGAMLRSCRCPRLSRILKMSSDRVSSGSRRGFDDCACASCVAERFAWTVHRISRSQIRHGERRSGRFSEREAGYSPPSWSQRARNRSVRSSPPIGQRTQSMPPLLCGPPLRSWVAMSSCRSLIGRRFTRA